jgi:glycosidase
LALPEISLNRNPNQKPKTHSRQGENIVANWSKEAIFYHIYPLGFCGAPKTNDHLSAPTPRLQLIENWIEHIRYLGANAIYFGPVFESDSHGYDTVDYYYIDRRLGTNETFTELSNLLHERNMRVIIDGVFNHVGRGFWAFQDVIKDGQNSKYRDWFSNLRFDKTSPYGDNFSYESWNGFYNLVKLNLKNEDLRKYLFDAISSWIINFNIDGLRLDCADCLDFDFLKDLNSFCKGIKPDFFLLGEVVHGHGSYAKWLAEGVLDSVTNYECYKSLYSSHNDANFHEVAFSLNRQFKEEYGLYRGLYLYSFADNHDVERIGSTLKRPADLYTLYAILFTMPGIPSIYYGSEWGIPGKKVSGSDEDLRPKLDLADISANSPNGDLPEAIAKFARIRKSSQALMHGRYKQLLVKSTLFCFARMSSEECIIVIINASEQLESVSLNIPVKGCRLIDLANQGEMFKIANGKCHIHVIYPNWVRILKVE